MTQGDPVGDEVAGTNEIAVRGGDMPRGAMLRMADFIRALRWEDIPPEVRAYAKVLVLDSVGCAIGGHETEPGRIMAQYFEHMGGAPEGSILATGRRVPAVHAAAVNSYLANVLDMDDTYAGIGHPGATVIPAALNLGERERVDGKLLLTAVVVGYEVSLRIGLAIQPTPERRAVVWGLSTWQAFGACAVACHLLGLDPFQIESAFGITGASTPVPAVGKVGLRPDEKPYSWLKNNYGFASLAGILGADLARRGFIGSRAILEGERGFWIMAGSDQFQPERLTEKLGEHYLLVETAIKPYAACRWIHPALDAAVALREAKGLLLEDIESVTVRTFRDAGTLMGYTVPVSEIDVQFNLPLLVALSLAGRPPVHPYADEELGDDRIHALARTTRVVVDKGMDERWERDHAMEAAVEVRMRSGDVYEQRVDVPRGEPENPLTTREIVRKFANLTHRVLGAEGVERAVAWCLALDEEQDVADGVRSWLGSNE